MIGLLSRRKNRQRIIAFAMVICFAVSFLPVTGSWYLSLKGRTDLSRLVIAAMAIKHHVEQKSSKKELAQSMDTIFKELKFATGQEKVSQEPDQKGIHLTQIIPEYPVLNLISTLNGYPEFSFLIPCQTILFQSLKFPPETPPPEGLSVS